MKSKIKKQNILIKRRTKKSKFKGSSIDIFFGMIFLLQKYNNICVLMSSYNYDNNMSDFIEDIYIKWQCFNKKYSLIFPKNYFENFKLCKKRFIMTPIYISEKDCLNQGHLNFLIIDKLGNNITIERFEPYGGDSFYLEKRFDKKLDKELKKHIPNSKYFPPTKLCPIIGPQQQEENNLNNSIGTPANTSDIGGYCGAWGIWYGNIRLNNPNIKPKDLLKLAMKQITLYPHSFRTFIKSYSKFIVTERKKLFKKLKCQENTFNSDIICINKFITRYLEKNLKKNI